MEQTMMWVALGIGLTGWIFTLLLATARPRSTSRGVAAFEERPAVETPFLWVALLLPVAVWLLTLPTTPPFSSGQGWGRGFLMGGLASAVTALVIFKAHSRQSSDYVQRCAATSPLFASIVAACVPLLWMRNAVIDVLVGQALGWIVVSLLFLLGLKVAERDERGALLSTLLLNSAAFATTVCGVAALGVYRDFVVASVTRGTYPAVAMLLAGVMALTLLFGALIGEVARTLRPSLTARQLASLTATSTVFLSLIFLLGSGALLSTKFLDDLNLTYVVAIGVGLGYLLWWLVWDGVAAKGEVEGGAMGAEVPTPASIAAMLVALCAFMLAYQIMQGFGVGLMLLVAWPVSLLALPTSAAPETGESVASVRSVNRYQTAQVLSLLLSFLAILLMSRLFEMRFRADLRGASLGDQFALFGFLCGAALPGLLASVWSSANESGATASRSLSHFFPVRMALPRLLLLGVLTLFLPGAVLALWGAKVLPAFFAGLALAAVFITSQSRRVTAPHTSAGALFSLSIAVALTQWTHHFAPLAEASRSQRLQVLLWATGGLLVLLLILDYSSRLLAALNARKTAVGTPKVSP